MNRKGSIDAKSCMFFLVKSASIVVLNNADGFFELLGDRAQIDFDCHR